LSSEDYSTAEKANNLRYQYRRSDLSSFATNTDLASKVDKVVGELFVIRRLFGRESEIKCNLRYQYRRSGFE
jgi:hypothetical protein